MTSSVVAELTADNTRLVLIGAGTTEDVALLAKQLRVLTPLIKPTDPKGAVELPASWPAVVQLAETFGDAWAPGPRLRDWINDEITARTADHSGAELTVAPVEGLTPRPYQVAGALMIAETGRALLGDEPGTGKTITTILGLSELHAILGGFTGTRTGVLPIVVVCPASVVDPWVDAFRAWAPHWRAVAWRGVRQRRHKLAGTADVYVTSYDTARMDADAEGAPLLGLGAYSLVVDEHHLIKNPHAARTAAVKRLARTAASFVALSGTPITHAPDDLHPTLLCLEPGAWPSRERWVQRYCRVARGDYKDEVIGLDPGTEAEFRTTLLGRNRRVAKADVLTQLPPKVYSVRSVTLPVAYRKAYDDMERDMLANLPDGDQLEVMSTLAQLTRLSQLACAAADVETTTEYDDDGFPRVHYTVTLKAPSWKVDALLEILGERPGQPVVCFSPSRQLMMLAGQAAEAAGLRVGYIVGGQAMVERSSTVAHFQAGGLDLVCATTGAGGVGLTLTAASCVVFLSRPWSLVESLQAEDRLHRIGAEGHESIEVIDVVAANTLDSRVRAVLRDKAGQLADLVQDPRIVAELLGGTTRKAAA